MPTPISAQLGGGLSPIHLPPLGAPLPLKTGLHFLFGPILWQILFIFNFRGLPSMTLNFLSENSYFIWSKIGHKIVRKQNTEGCTVYTPKLGVIHDPRKISLEMGP